jgi:hypothetical protein
MKRALFLTLLLANIVILAWSRWYAAPDSVSQTAATPLAGKPLELATELTPAQRKDLATSEAASAASGTAPVVAPSAATGALAANAVACAAYGPFASDDVVQLAAGRLKPLGLDVTDHLVPGKSKLGYWVYLPPFGSKREADAAAALLKKRGVKDIYVVTDEANRNAISLGVFTQKSGAQDRQKEMHKMGYHALMAERFRDEPRYWLDAKGLAGALPSADMFKDLADESAPIGKAIGACPG